MENMVNRIFNKVSALLLKFIDGQAYTDFSVRSYNHKIGFHRNDYNIHKDEYALIHVPKTAGTSLKSVLSSVPVQIVNNGSHMPIPLIAPPQYYRYITFLRDPIERVFSYYRMQLCDKTQPYHHLAKDGLATLLQNCWEVRNIYCQYFSGFVYETINEHYMYIALDNLNNFYFVGDFSNFSNDVNRLLKKLHIDSAKNIPRLNVSQQYSIDEKNNQLISAYNEMDISLYAKYEYRTK